MKVDIEGAEINFLKGAIETLIKYRPMIFMALHSPQLFELLFETIDIYKLPYLIKNFNGNLVSKCDYLDEIILEPI